MRSRYAVAVLILLAGAVSAQTVRSSRALLKAVRATGPRTIRLLPGAYVIDEPIVIKSEAHVNIIGSGWNTGIIRKGEGPAIVFEDSHFCFVSDLLISGGNEATDGIVYQGVSSSNTVRSCRITSFTGSGVRYDGDKDGPMSSNSVLYTHFIDNEGEQLRSYYNNDFYIIGNQYGCWQKEPKVGAALIHSSAGTYSINYHWSNDVAMTLGPGSDYNRIGNNRFEMSRTNGIVIGNPETPDQWNRYNTFIGNTIHTNSMGQMRGHDAVVVYDSHDTIFSGNQIFSWYPPTTHHKSGLVLGRGCSTCIVTGNILRHNSEPAIVAADDVGHIIKDNLVDTKPWGEE